MKKGDDDDDDDDDGVWNVENEKMSVLYSRSRFIVSARLSRIVYARWIFFEFYDTTSSASINHQSSHHNIPSRRVGQVVNSIN
jgi:hypothetical protein